MAARRIAEGRDVSDRYERVPPPKMAVAYRHEVVAQVSERLWCCFDQQLILYRPLPLPPLALSVRLSAWPQDALPKAAMLVTALNVCPLRT